VSCSFAITKKNQDKRRSGKAASTGQLKEAAERSICSTVPARPRDKAYCVSPAIREVGTTFTSDWLP